jgi:hypothetical protein
VLTDPVRLFDGGSSTRESAELAALGELSELWNWAVNTGVARSGNLTLLLDTERAREDGARADRRVAATHGIGIRTLYRRRSVTLTALRAALPEYLAAVS